MLRRSSIIERIKRLEALAASTTFEGERANALSAAARLREQLEQGNSAYAPTHRSERNFQDLARALTDSAIQYLAARDIRIVEISREGPRRFKSIKPFNDKLTGDDVKRIAREHGWTMASAV